MTTDTLNDEYRVVEVLERSDPPPRNQHTARNCERNSTLRRDVAKLLDRLDVGQGFKVYGVSAQRVRNTIQNYRASRGCPVTTAVFSNGNHVRVWVTGRRG